MNGKISFNLSQIPKDIGGSRLGNLYYFLDNLTEGNSITIPRNMGFPVKSESMVMLSLVKGSIRLKVNLQDVEVHKEEVLVLTPGCIFQLMEYSEDFQYFCMMISTEVIDSIQKSFGIHLDLSHRYYNFMVHQATSSSMELGLTMYHLIKEEINQPDYETKKEVILRYCEIWILKNASYANPEDKQQEIRKPVGRKEQIFRDFLTLLEKYYTQERSISFYADRMCLTPKYLSTIVKEVSGKHGMQWIDEYVALEAKALLREGSLSVKMVSDKLNFPSQSMFGRFFKKMTGYSPKQYMLL